MLKNLEIQNSLHRNKNVTNYHIQFKYSPLLNTAITNVLKTQQDPSYVGFIVLCSGNINSTN